VNELARLANGADRGALANVVEELARLARVDGELTELVRETARLSGAKADEIHARLAREGPGSGPEVST
jgi:transposase-like protein